MFCPDKNAFLQLVCPLEPRVINKAVRRALRKKWTIPEDKSSTCIALPPAKKLESTQPSLSAHFVDITQAHLGFGRRGLQILIRELNSDDNLTKLRAIHTLLDQVQIPDNIFYLIELNAVYRLINLMLDNNPIVREKICITLTRLGMYKAGRKKIISWPVVVDRLIGMIMEDRKEVRYAASLCLKTLTRDRCACEVIIQNDRIIESLLKMIKHDYMEIILYHLNSLKNLSEWDPVTPLKANAFQVMRQLLVNYYHKYRVVQAAMDCMTQLCKHPIGKKLADKYDINRDLLNYLLSPNVEVIASTVGLMQYTTMTPMSKWRAKQFTFDLVKRLITCAISHNIPVLQLRSMQVLLNLSDCSEVKLELKKHWEDIIINKIHVATCENWVGTTEITSFGVETGYNYETMCLEDVRVIDEDYGDTVQPFDVHSYSSRISDLKQRLLKAINTKNYKC